MSSLAQTLWIDSGPQTLDALANLFQCRFKSLQFLRACIGKDFPNFGGVFAKNRRDQSFAFFCEFLASQRRAYEIKSRIPAEVRSDTGWASSSRDENFGFNAETGEFG